jgi:hypothetical protein
MTKNRIRKACELLEAEISEARRKNLDFPRTAFCRELHRYIAMMNNGTISPDGVSQMLTMAAVDLREKMQYYRHFPVDTKYRMLAAEIPIFLHAALLFCDCPA